MTGNIIDISHWEDPIDFGKVADAGIIAVIAKATQGATEVDGAYARFKANAAPHAFLWGSYHFGTSDDVTTQVDHYIKTASPAATELVCLDFEPNPVGPAMSLDQARDFVELFEQRTGRYPVLYGGRWLKDSLAGKADDTLSKCPLWIAQYGPKVVLPPGWNSYVLWQYTESERGIPGVNSTDRDQFDGSDLDLRKQWPFS